MIFNLYSIKDKKSDFAAPVPVKDDATARRWFDHEVKNNSFMTEYKEDFELYNLGTFDAESGEVERIPFPMCIMTAEEVFTNGKNFTVQNGDEC